jgi:hypothetical protein
MAVNNGPDQAIHNALNSAAEVVYSRNRDFFASFDTPNKVGTALTDVSNKGIEITQAFGVSGSDVDSIVQEQRRMSKELEKTKQDLKTSIAEHKHDQDEIDELKSEAEFRIVGQKNTIRLYARALETLASYIEHLRGSLADRLLMPIEVPDDLRAIYREFPFLKKYAKR